MARNEHPDSIALRVAHNDNVFRESNEQINDFARSLEMYDRGRLPFLCECADIRCTEVLQLTSDEYEAVRQSPIRFINATGHERAEGWVRVVERSDRYTIVEKIGEAAEIVEELDPRGGTSQ